MAVLCSLARPTAPSRFILDMSFPHLFVLRLSMKYVWVFGLSLSQLLYLLSFVKNRMTWSRYDNPMQKLPLHNDEC